MVRVKRNLQRHTCKYCELTVEHQGTANVTKEKLFEEGWRNYRRDGWMCPECVLDYDMSCRFHLIGPGEYTNEELHAAVDASLRRFYREFPSLKRSREEDASSDRA